MAHRYQAPEHTSAVFAPSGEFRADDNGVIELPDDAPDSAHNAVRRAGCVLVSGDPPAPKLTVDAYCDAYIAGEGRDDNAMLEFAVNHGPEIEAEFQRRAAAESGSDDDASAKAKSKN